MALTVGFEPTLRDVRSVLDYPVADVSMILARYMGFEPMFPRVKTEGPKPLDEHRIYSYNNGEIYGIRTRVSTLRGLSPKPLDEYLIIESIVLWVP